MRAPLVIVVAVCVAYANAFWGVFQFDDYNVIIDNPAVHSWSGWFGDLEGIRPVLKLANTFNWTSGAGPFGFHLVNLCVHAANAVTIYYLYARAVEDKAIAVSAALVFALHPIQTEAVTYISGRATSLMAMFYLASVLAYARGRSSGSRRWLYVISPLLFALAVLTKEVAVTLPLALVLWELIGPRRGGALHAQAVHWILLGGIAVVLCMHAGYSRSLAYGFGVRGVCDNVRSQIDGVWYLLSKIAWPAHLDIDPALPTVTAWSWALAGKALVIAALFGTGIAHLRRRPWLAFVILWFFVHLVPTNSIVPRRDIVNEREVYLAMAGWALVASVAASRLPIRWRRGILVAVLVSLGVGTMLRNLDYRSEIALWEAAVRDAPANPRAYHNLGYAYELDGDRARARRAYEVALQLRSDYPLAWYHLKGLERQ